MLLNPYIFLIKIIVVVRSPRPLQTAAEVLQLFKKVNVPLRPFDEGPNRDFCCCSSFLTPKVSVSRERGLQFWKKRQAKTSLFQKVDAPLLPFAWFLFIAFKREISGCVFLKPLCCVLRGFSKMHPFGMFFSHCSRWFSFPNDRAERGGAPCIGADRLVRIRRVGFSGNSGASS